MPIPHLPSALATADAAPFRDLSAAGSGLRRWTGFAAMCLGMFMAILDVQIVATALPDLQAALVLRQDQVSWIQTVYLIAEIIAIPLTGWLTRLLSTRGLFAAGVLGFTAGSLLCAASGGFAMLVVSRAIQGFFGGVLIPVVFSAGFLMFPGPAQPRATMLAGVAAMLAPTLGPVLGGWVTETWSWHWIFLINVPPGIVAAALVLRCVAIDRPDPAARRGVDLGGLVLLALSLAALEILLKEAPARGWSSPGMIGLAALCVAAAVAAVRLDLARPAPVVTYRTFAASSSFAAGCAFSFALGIGLYGSIYLMSLFLGLVRMHSAIEIGAVIAVTGVAQLVAAPVATVLEKRIDPRPLVFVGYAAFAIGAGLSAAATPATDFAGMFWPQVLRGASIMFCLLPTTTAALGALRSAEVPGGSGLFNMMRNLGGAIGLALIDTVLERRTPGHVEALATRLQAGDASAASFVGLSTDRFTGVPLGDIDQATRDFVAPLVERAALAQSMNEAWLMLALLLLLPLIVLPLLRSPPPPSVSGPESTRS
ncbi:MAG TPA: DHA2 family efflux MFS transporter permease subunit [Stellaceae bacterium]